MPSLPRDQDNFINGLADFWVAFFENTDFTRAYFQAGQMMLGQVYLELLQAVLAKNLNHCPLFSKRYFQYLPVREDQVSFIEGKTTADDRWAYNSGEVITAISSIINKVIAPTRTLDNLIDYEVADGLVQFIVDPFNVDDENDTITQFPVRTVQVVAQASALHPRNVDWRTLGALPGDSLWFINPVGLPRTIPGIGTVYAYPPASLTKITTILSIDSATYRLQLDMNLPEFGANLQGRNFNLYVVRLPYDYQIVGEPTPQPIESFSSVGLTLTAGTTNATVVTAPVGITPSTAQFVYVSDAGNPLNSGFYQLQVISGTTWTLSAPANFYVSSGPVTAYLVDYGLQTPVSLVSPTFQYSQTLIDPGSLTITGQRAVARVLYNTNTPIPNSTNYVIDPVSNTVTYPAGEDVEENVDYAIDYFNGLITYLTVWNPSIQSYSNFTWKLLIASETITYQGTFSPSATYNQDDQVLYAGNYYISTNGSAAHAFNIGEWTPFVSSPFAGNNVFNLREIGCWGVDQYVDEQLLYNNFGYLLGFQKPTSEQYRQFLLGVSQLFLLGPSLGRFRSALNVVAGLPVIRTTGEILEDYDSGFVDVSTLTDPTTGDGGQLIDSAYGADGVLDNGASTFYSPSVMFFQSDVGAVLHIQDVAGYTDYAITAVSADGSTATIVPAPPDMTGVHWEFQHSLFQRRFRINSSNVTYLFTDADVNGAIVIASAYDARNVGSFNIAAVIGPRELVLETPYGFFDVTGLDWQFTRTRVQTVTTSLNTYTLPVGMPMQANVTNTDNFGIYSFTGFDVLSDAIDVVDYLSDPTWFYHIQIPYALMTQTPDAPGRRQVTPALIPHIINAIDGAVINDWGIFADADTNGVQGIIRSGQVTWLGGPWIRLDFAIGTTVPPARNTDIGMYLVIPSGTFKGSYQVQSISPDGSQIQVSLFPPPAAQGITAPVVIPYAELPPILYRHTVAFHIFDKFLKYHSFLVRINTQSGLPPSFITDVSQILNQAKPAHTYCYFQPSTSFYDEMEATDSLALTWGPILFDTVYQVENEFTGITQAQANDFHATFAESVTASPSAGPLTITLSPTFPWSPDHYTYIFGRFSVGTSGGVPLDLGYNCSFDYATGVVTVPNYDGGPYEFDFLVVSFRNFAYASPDWWTTGATDQETPSCVGGGDILLYSVPGIVPMGTYGIVDRPLEITIS